MKFQQCVIDLAIVLVTIPSLIVVALLLEYMMNHIDWAERLESQIIVLGLGVAFFVICVMVAVYFTHRIGACLWAGPLPDDRRAIFIVEQELESGPPPDYDTILLDPPSYEKLDIKYLLFLDEPPPSYAASVASLEGAHI
uniref:Putative secreted protein n=1 Tax=Psorophora albipes TaxID=869069 RepID=T1E378_9DIPT